MDGLAAGAGRAIDVEDRRFRLLAYSAHDGPIDDVRRDTILRRAATPAVVERLERLGVTEAREPVRLPAAPELGMGARVCLPVRERGALLGLVWVFDDPPLADAEVAGLAVAAEQLGPALAALRDHEDERRGDEQRALVALLTTGDPAPAAALLAAPAPLRVVVAAAGTDLAGLRRLAGTGRVLTGEHDGLAVALLVATAPPADTDAVLGVGDPVARLAEAAVSHRQAVLARRVALAVPDYGPVARFAALGAHGLLAPLAFPADGGPPAALPVALATVDGAPEGRALLTTLRAVLDAGGDVGGAAARLHVHRSTLHRRLRRVEQLTGVDLADGRVRLELHAGLVLRDLLTPPPPRPAGPR